ncbi:DHH family phosphoesterase [Mycoplasmopsis agassizii]|nr:DHH family phosphoesterase [Mycoplasmopsis agassizii]
MKKFYIIGFSVFATAMLGAFIAWLIIEITKDQLQPNLVAIGALALILTAVSVMAFSYFLIRYLTKKNYFINRSFYQYLDKVIAQHKIGVLILNPLSKIVWSSEYLNNELGSNLIDRKLAQVFPEVKDQLVYDDEDDILIKREKNGVTVIYLLKRYNNYNMVTIEDVTVRESIITNYRDEKIAVGEIEIDNYQLYQSVLSEEEIFNIEATIVDLLENLVKEYNIAYRQYVKGKFIIITNNETIEKLIKSEFNFIEQLENNSKLKSNVRLTISMGIARGMYKISELFEVSKSALRQSQSRGGDQVTIYQKDQKPIFFGSKSEISVNYSRTMIKEVARLLEHKLTSKSINKVIVYGHKLADLDAFGSAYAMVWLAKQFGKEAYIQNVTFDNTTKKAIAKYLGKPENLFIKPSTASQMSDENTLVIIVDTAEAKRIENENAFNKVKPENIFVLDHHRVSENVQFCPLQNQYIETTASSASEITTEVISFIKHELKHDAVVSQMLLNGIYMDTNQFQKSTSGPTFNAAALLEFRGASAIEAVELLKVSEENNKIIKKLVDDIKEIKTGFFISYTSNEVPEDIVSIAADEMLRISGRKAVFVIAKIPHSNPALYKMSARGIKTNVQIIAEAVGGGGHYAAAAAVSNEEIEKFVDNIVQAIVSVKYNESNIN